MSVELRHDVAMAMLAGTRPRRILEVGCGAGHALTMLVARFPDAEVVGIDRSATQVVKARQRIAFESRR